MRTGRGNFVVNFKFHDQTLTCEFLVHSRKLTSFVKYQISAFTFSLDHLHNINRQSTTSETTDRLLIPLALASNILVHFSSPFWPHHNVWHCLKCQTQVVQRTKISVASPKPNQSTFGQRNLMLMVHVGDFYTTYIYAR